MADWESIAKQSEELLAKPDIKGCHEILISAYDAGNRNPQILWRLARSYYEMAEESEDQSVRQSYIKTGLELCQESVKADPNNFASHKWLGILISAQAVGTKEKIGNAYIIRDEFLKAIELNPRDATSLHCMGNWCFSVLQVSWLERKAASLLFAEPPNSTYEECLKYLKASAEIADTIFNATLIGDCYYHQKNFSEAKQWYEKALGMPASTELQKRHQSKAKLGLSKC